SSTIRTNPLGRTMRVGLTRLAFGVRVPPELYFLSRAARIAFWRGSVTGGAAPKLSVEAGGGGDAPGGSGCGSNSARVSLSSMKYCLATRRISAAVTLSISARYVSRYL